MGWYCGNSFSLCNLAYWRGQRGAGRRGNLWKTRSGKWFSRYICISCTNMTTSLDVVERGTGIHSDDRVELSVLFSVFLILSLSWNSFYNLHYYFRGLSLQHFRISLPSLKFWKPEILHHTILYTSSHVT